MRYSNTFRSLLGLSLLSGMGLTGCTAKEDIDPDKPCATSAIVRLCHGRTAACPTLHTTLELADGTRVQPTGKLWEDYQPKQAEGQYLRVGFKRISQPSAVGASVTVVALTCLEQSILRCGNE
jgi:hypothetical protein